MPYLVINNAGRSNGGIRPPMPAGTPPFWLVYFATEDLDATLAKVSELGGNVLMGNTDIGSPGSPWPRIPRARCSPSTPVAWTTEPQRPSHNPAGV